VRRCRTVRAGVWLSSGTRSAISKAAIYDSFCNGSGGFFVLQLQKRCREERRPRGGGMS
jgi:hypothetical protein